MAHGRSFERLLLQEETRNRGSIHPSLKRKTDARKKDRVLSSAMKARIVHPDPWVRIPVI